MLQVGGNVTVKVSGFNEGVIPPRAGPVEDRVGLAAERALQV